jgi:hypothetical protein
MNNGKSSVDPGTTTFASCGARFDLQPQSGQICCELPHGHDSRWHRNEHAGFEWSGRLLWLLPPSTLRAA